jgi:hypothetical protein
MRDTSSPSLAIAGVGNSSGVAGAIAGQDSYELGEFFVMQNASLNPLATSVLWSLGSCCDHIGFSFYTTFCSARSTHVLVLTRTFTGALGAGSERCAS